MLTQRNFIQHSHAFVTHLLLLACLCFPNFLTMSRYYLQSEGLGVYFCYKLSPKQLRSFLNMFWEHQKRCINSYIQRLARGKKTVEKMNFTHTEQKWEELTSNHMVGEGLPRFHHLQSHTFQTSGGLPMQTQLQSHPPFPKPASSLPRFNLQQNCFIRDDGTTSFSAEVWLTA